MPRQPMPRGSRADPSTEADARRPDEIGIPPIRIRRATIRDVDVAAPLFDAYRMFYGKASDVEAARAFLAARLSRDESVVLLADFHQPPGDVSLVVGFAQLYRSFSSLSLGTIVILNDLFVLPSARRCGAARRLVEEATALAASEGARCLELATQHANEPALALYQSLGFVPDTEFRHLSLTLRVPDRDEGTANSP